MSLSPARLPVTPGLVSVRVAATHGRARILASLVAHLGIANPGVAAACRAVKGATVVRTLRVGVVIARIAVTAAPAVRRRAAVIRRTAAVGVPVQVPTVAVNVARGADAVLPAACGAVRIAVREPLVTIRTLGAAAALIMVMACQKSPIWSGSGHVRRHRNPVNPLHRLIEGITNFCRTYEESAHKSPALMCA